MTVPITTRNANLDDLAGLLQSQQDAKLDMVCPAKAIRSVKANLFISGTPVPGPFRPTDVADEGIADKLRIPGAYLRRLRTEHPDLYDDNVNGWMGRDDRSFLLRTFRPNGNEGVARALLSSKYRMIDNIDVLLASLAGVRAAGAPVEIQGCDLTERRMYVRVFSPAITALAPKLLERYRSPFTGASGADNPVVFGGFVISNSETGGGAFTITPRLVVQVCQNGMTITKDALRSVHIGGKLDEGVIRWSDETQQRSLELVTAQAKDAVQTFLDVDYMTSVIDRLTEQAGTPITKPAEKIETICNKLAYPQERQEAILSHFIQGGDLTAGGVMQAFTSVAQVLEDADQAMAMESDALRALELAVVA